MIYEYECEKHGVFSVTVPVREWKRAKKCPKRKCSRISPQVLRPSGGRKDGNFKVVVHITDTGEYRLPGSADAKVPKHCRKIEFTSIREVEAFERKMNTKMRSEAQIHNANERAHFDPIYAKNRSELRQAMQKMSPYGRDFAELAMKMNDEKPQKKSDVGFHCEVLHFDQSNREPHRDERTGWQPRKA